MDEDIGIICRQTTYTEEEATEQYKIHGGDIVKVLEAFHGIQQKDTSKERISQSVNQTIYKELRQFMDKSVQPSTVPQS
jgi:thiamine pyrophosphate-dependent acetolactate synthase large subunit-like protein